MVGCHSSLKLLRVDPLKVGTLNFYFFQKPKGAPMKLRPLHDRVIVKRVENETKTASGIVIPDSAAEKPDQGEVLAVGPGKKNDKGEVSPMAVKVGDRVLFGKYSGQTVKVDGDELLVMKEDDLFAVVEK
ncbi:MAG: chaperonin GroES [Rhodoferax sp.]